MKFLRFSLNKINLKYELSDKVWYSLHKNNNYETKIWDRITNIENVVWFQIWDRILIPLDIMIRKLI